jgi:hypothetical protein
MVRLSLGALCLALFVLSPAAPLAGQGTASTRELPKQTAATETVYITRTGEKYHRAGCRSLAKSAIPMALSEAAQRYGACKVCQPPTLGAKGAAPPVPAASTTSTDSPAAAVEKSPRETPTPRSNAQRCAATTKKVPNAPGTPAPVARSAGSTAGNVTAGGARAVSPTPDV